MGAGNTPNTSYLKCIVDIAMSLCQGWSTYCWFTMRDLEKDKDYSKNKLCHISIENLTCLI